MPTPLARFPWLQSIRRMSCLTCGLLVAYLCATSTVRGELLAGAAKIDITNDEAGPTHGALHARALCLSNSRTTVAMITLDVVSIGEIGYIKNDFLPNLRARLQSELGINPEQVIVNASHCHGVPCEDVGERTFRAVQQAMSRLTPVRVGVGTGSENRISENRRVKLQNGREADVRHAYAMPADQEVVEVGPIDPEIGIVRFDALDGKPVALIYNFACHPIQGVPGIANTADLTGFASETIEDNLGAGAVALFVQGCGGDINPVYYKDVDHPRDAEPLGNQLAISTLKGARAIESRLDDRLELLHEVIPLPRADLAPQIADLEAEQTRLTSALRGTSLNLKTFLPLVVKYNLAAEFPSYYSPTYLHERQLARNHLDSLDADNRRNMQQYIANILTMEQLTRVQINLALLRKHQQDYLAAGSRTIDVEVVGLRVSDSVWITFPGELTVRIGLNIKAQSPHEQTFVAGYTNGYIYYAPTAEQLANVGGAQEDSDCILAPEWHAIFETKAMEFLQRLSP